MRVLESFSRTWGGAANVILPWHESGVPSLFWRLLERFDPDYVATFVETLRGWRLSRPDAFERWLDEQSVSWSREHGASADDFKERLQATGLDQSLGSPEPDASISREILLRSAPYHYGDRVVASALLSEQGPPSPCIDLAEVDVTNAESIVDVITSDLDPTIALMVALYAGSLSPSYRDRLEARSAIAASVSLSSSQAGELLSFYWDPREGVLARTLGALRRAKSNDEMPPWSEPEFFSRTPFAGSRVGCSWVVQARDWIEAFPTVVVVGDSIDDFCLALSLDRLWGNGRWLPASVMSGSDEASHSVQYQHGRHTMRRNAADGALLVTSMSLPSEAALSLEASSPFKRAGSPVARYCAPAALPLGRGPKRLVDVANPYVPQYMMIADQMLAGLIEPPRPSAISCSDWTRFRWEIDVSIERHRLPVRSCLGELLCTPEERVGLRIRPSSAGVSFQSRSMGFVPGGTPEQLTVVRPRIRVPAAAEVFAVLSREAELELETSSAGRYTEGILRLWGGLRPLAADLTSKARNAVLQSFRSKAPSESGTGVRLAGMDRRYLSRTDVSGVSGLGEAEASSLCDEYLEMEVFLPGYCLWCERCGFSGWYHVQDVGAHFRCARCRADCLFDSRARKGAEATLYYALNELAYQAINNDCRAPLLALAELADDFDEFDFVPESNLKRSGKLVAEIDIMAIAKGMIVVGEAKVNGTLASGAGAARKKAGKLVQVADAMTADVIVFATTAPEWGQQAKDAILKATENSPCKTRLMENLGN